MANSFYFKGGVAQLGQGGSSKFLLFLLNGNKEVSFFDGKKYGFVSNSSRDEWTTDCAVIKVFMQEQEFGKAKFMQSFYLVLGTKLDRQTVTIKPRNLTARGLGYQFSADAKFMKKSEALSLLDPESIAYKCLLAQCQPPVQVLKEIISIDRHGPPKESITASHGAVRQLRIHK